MKDHQVLDALFSRPNGKTSSLREMIDYYKERRDQMEEVQIRCEAEIASYDEGIAFLRRQLGDPENQEELIDLVRETKETCTPSSPRKTSRGAALYGKDTGIHAEQKIRGLIEDMPQKNLFLTRGLLATIEATGQWPDLERRHVTRVLTKLAGEGIVRRSSRFEWSKTSPSLLKKRKDEPHTTRPCIDDKGTIPKHNGEVGSVLLEVIHDLSNKHTGFTRQEVLDEVEIEQKSFDNAMNHLSVKGLVKRLGKKKGIRPLYIASW